MALNRACLLVLTLNLALSGCASQARTRPTWQADLTLEEFRSIKQAFTARVERKKTLPLGTSVEAWATYIAAFHRSVHMQFAVGFLPTLPRSGALGDAGLTTTVEIVVNSDGTLERVGIVEGSGVEQFDLGVYSAVRRGAPYPAPPEQVRSADGRAYLHWSFHRSESQCGPWNAEPFLLRVER